MLFAGYGETQRFAASGPMLGLVKNSTQPTDLRYGGRITPVWLVMRP
jgi:hypothetical protein